jgi:hypothetical protein
MRRRNEGEPTKAEAGIRWEQELARLFVRSGWTQEELVKREGKSKGWIDQRLRFGRFLNFPTMVGNPGTPRTAAWKGFPLR